MYAVVVVFDVRNAVAVPFFYCLLETLLVADDIPRRSAIELEITLIVVEGSVKTYNLFLGCDEELLVFKSLFERNGVCKLSLGHVL